MIGCTALGAVWTQKKTHAERYRSIEVEYGREKDKYVAVYGDVIGTFPEKIGERLEEQEPTFVIFDSADETEEGDEIIYKPYVKIYW